MVKYIYYLLYIHIHIVDVCRCIDVYIIDREQICTKYSNPDVRRLLLGSTDLKH